MRAFECMNFPQNQGQHVAHECTPIARVHIIVRFTKWSRGRTGRRWPGGAGGRQVVMGGWAAAAAHAGGHECPSPRPPAATALAQGGKKTPAPARPFQRLLGVRGSAGGGPLRRLGARTGSRVGPRGLGEASRGRGSQETRTSLLSSRLSLQFSISPSVFPPSVCLSFEQKRKPSVVRSPPQTERRAHSGFEAPERPPVTPSLTLSINQVSGVCRSCVLASPASPPSRQGAREGGRGRIAFRDAGVKHKEGGEGGRLSQARAGGKVAHRSGS